MRQISAPIQEIIVDGDSDGSLGSKLGDGCIICAEEIYENEEGVFTGCGERHGPIHPACRERWIQTELSRHRDPTCPICRRLIRLRVESDGVLQVRPEPSRAMLSLTQVLRSLFGGAHGLFMGTVLGIFAPVTAELVGVIVLLILIGIVALVAALAAAVGGAGGDCGNCDNCCDCNNCGDSCCDCGGPATEADALYFGGPCPYDPFWGYTYYGLGVNCNGDCNCDYRRTWRCGSAREWFEIASQALFLPGVIVGLLIGCKSGIFMFGLETMSAELSAIGDIISGSTTPTPNFLSPTSQRFLPPTIQILPSTTTAYAITTRDAYEMPKLVNMPGFLSRR